jgi:hypothetical protein
MQDADFKFASFLCPGCQASHQSLSLEDTQPTKRPNNILVYMTWSFFEKLKHQYKNHEGNKLPLHNFIIFDP